MSTNLKLLRRWGRDNLFLCRKKQFLLEIFEQYALGGGWMVGYCAMVVRLQKNRGGASVCVQVRVRVSACLYKCVCVCVQVCTCVCVHP